MHTYRDILLNQVFSRVNKASRLCKFQTATSHFLFSCEIKISMELARTSEKLLPAKASPIASLNLSISH